MRVALRIVLILSLLWLAACQAASPGAPFAGEGQTSPGQLTPPQAQTLIPSATLEPSSRLPPSATPALLPTATLTEPPPTHTTAPTILPLPGGSFQVRWHPDGALYSGDKLSLEVIAEAEAALEGRALQAHLVTAEGRQLLGSAEFGSYGLGNRRQATLWWFWDTAGLQPGEYEIELSVQPDGLAWVETVDLMPPEQMPPVEAGAAWESVENDCCLLYYIQGTAAERDLSRLLVMIDEQAQDAAQKLGINPAKKIPITLLPRVLGHGGFTSGEIAVSYLDRNYAGNGSNVVLHHEIIHWWDGSLGGELRPSLFVEGLAVYLTGGHFKLEPLLPRAAALLPPGENCLPASAQMDLPVEQPPSGKAVCSLGGLVPLAQLADNFYPSQHETGYLEAGALVAYLVERWGWQAFNEFYRDIQPQPTPASQPQAGLLATAVPALPADSQAAAINAALQKHFVLTLDELERDFIEALGKQTLTPAAVEDVRLSIEYYDAVRRYQELLDPSAYFLFAWLADGEQMRTRGIVADYVRHPAQLENLALETMFVAADAALRAGDTQRADRHLEAIQLVLESFVADSQEAFTADPLAADYYRLAQIVTEAGYQAQQIELDGDQAQVWASQAGPQLVLLRLERSPQGWRIDQTVYEFDYRAQCQDGIATDRCTASRIAN